MAIIEVTKATDDLTIYERFNPGFTTTGELLTEEWEESGKVRGITRVVFKGKYTAYGMCRDCGDHYIIARYSRYDRIDKATLKITEDVEDR